MRKLILLTICFACSATLSLAQAPQDDQKNEFFGGYSFHSAGINTLTINPQRTSQNGVDVEYTRNVTRDLGITGDLSAHFHRDSSGITGGTFKQQRDQYFVLGGVQFKKHNEGRLQPFTHALFGASLFHGFTSASNASGNVFTFDDATAFAMALGGGLDIRTGKRFDVRLIQADYTPTHFGSGWQHNFRLSVGIIYKR